MAEFSVALIAVLAGAVASVAGFGIGSLLTPALSLQLGTKLAISIVSIPHFFATFIRVWILRKEIDRYVVLHFGITSAAGGLLGAILHTKFSAPALTLTFGAILIFAGSLGVSGFSEKLRFGRRTAWLGGALSGLLGGLVGNQGGIRSAAMLGFNIRKEAFVASATAIGLIVDIARMPVYFWADWEGIVAHSWWVIFTVLGAVLGTFLGITFLRQVPERQFKRVVSALILVLGIFMAFKGWGEV